MYSEGIALCLLSALCFSAMTIFGKLAYGAQVGVLTLLSVRFLLGGAGLALLARASAGRAPMGERRAFLRALLLGAVVYAAQSAALFTALTELDASLAVLLLYAYPALVVVGALALRREQPSAAKLGALLLASAGISLVLWADAGGTGGVDAAGVLLGLLAAAGYAVYVLAADDLVRDADPLAMSAAVCTGAGLSFMVAAVVSGSLAWPGSEGWLWIAAITLVSTIGAIGALFAGIRRVGASTASLASTVEPVGAVALAFVVFGETLSAVQLGGAALVVAALLVLSTAPTTTRRTTCQKRR